MKCADSKKEGISLLASLDENYLPQLKVLLTSVAASNPGQVKGSTFCTAVLQRKS